MPRITLLAALVLTLVGATAGQATAGPAPDGDPIASTASVGPISLTLPFALGEVDLSSLGVSDAELLSVGPTVSLTSASGDVLIVDNDLLDCPNAQFVTIQSAVNAAAPGDKIKVCPGTYIEQVTIPAGKNNLTLFSEGARQAIIKAPPVMVAPQAIVRVNGAQDVTIRHFTITGPGGSGCNSIRYGVFVDNGGSALITDNHITEIRDFGLTLSGCQNGIGVSVGRELMPDGPTAGSATVVHNLIDNYQKGGVLVDGASSSAEVAYNEVIGAGPTPFIAQNGIQLSREAHAEAHHNKVSRNFYLGSDDATGFLLFMNPDARVHHNSVFLNEAGIGTFSVNGTAEVSYNSARNNVDGIVAFSMTTKTLITHNKAFENTNLDCRDDNLPTTTNSWIKDLGRTQNQPGLCKQAGP